MYVELIALWSHKLQVCMWIQENLFPFGRLSVRAEQSLYIDSSILNQLTHQSKDSTLETRSIDLYTGPTDACPQYVR